MGSPLYDLPDKQNDLVPGAIRPFALLALYLNALVDKVGLSFAGNGKQHMPYPGSGSF